MHHPPSNYAATFKCTSSRSGKEVADSEKLSVTADPVAGGDNDKFELATFSSPRVRRSGTPLLHCFDTVFYLLSAAGIGTPNVEPIQQQHIEFSKQCPSRGKWLLITNFIESKTNHELPFICT